jgi:hypothetical protein
MDIPAEEPTMNSPLIPCEDRSEERLVDDQSAKRILRSAAELDAVRRERVTIGELRRVALEAGISSEAFDAALIRFSGAPPTSLVETLAPREETEFRESSPVRMMALAATGMGFGAMIGWIHALSLSNNLVFLAPLAAATVISLSLAARYRSGGKLGDFISEHLGLFVSLLSGFALWHPEFAAREFTVGMALIGMTAMTMGLVGAGVVTTRFVHEPPRAHRANSGDDTGSTRGAGRGLGGWLRRAARWVDRKPIDRDQDVGFSYRSQRSEA